MTLVMLGKVAIQGTGDQGQDREGARGDYHLRDEGEGGRCQPRVCGVGGEYLI